MSDLVPGGSKHGRFSELMADPQSTALLVRDGMLQLTEVGTGVASGGYGQGFKAIGHLVQASLSWRLFDQFMSEWTAYREEGRIADDYEETPQFASCVHEYLEALDNDPPDAERLDFLKKVFLATATEELSDRESPVPQQMMKLARSIDSTEILVFGSIANRGQNDPFEGNFAQHIANLTGLQYAELVTRALDSLDTKRLINKQASARFNQPSGRGEMNTTVAVPTKLGEALARFISHT